jgi:hypothetical protein
VDVQPALPALSRTITENAALLIGYCTIVMRVVGGDDCPPKYYVLVRGRLERGKERGK